MTDGPRLVELRSAAPLLSDVPGMLRRLADELEAQPVRSALVIIPVEGDWPNIRGYGDNLGDYGNIAVLALAQQWFVKNRTERSS